MDVWQTLNGVYRPLYEAACSLAAVLREAGICAQLRYYNLHEIRRCGAWQTEYFPTPELELKAAGICADLGLRLDGDAWCELHLSRSRALALDIPALAAAFSVEIYGARCYREDFYNAELSAEAAAARISASDEEEICIQAELGPVERAASVALSLFHFVGCGL